MSENYINVVNDVPSTTITAKPLQTTSTSVNPPKRTRKVKRKLNSKKENKSLDEKLTTGEAVKVEELNVDEVQVEKKLEPTIEQPKLEESINVVEVASKNETGDVKESNEVEEKAEENVINNSEPTTGLEESKTQENAANLEELLDSVPTELPETNSNEEKRLVKIKKPNLFTRLKNKIISITKRKKNTEEDNEEEEEGNNDEENEGNEENEQNDENENDDENDEDYVDSEDLFLSAIRSPFDGWDYEINKKEKDKLEKYKELVERLKTKLPKFHKILESNMSDQDKEECLWQVAILNDAHFNDDYVEEMHKINKKLNYFSRMSPEDLEKYNALELKFKDLYDNEKPLKNRILDLPVNEDIKRIIYRHYLMHGTSSEKETKWLDIVLSIPWGKYTKVEIPNPAVIMKEWEECVEGMNPAKEEFILTLTDYVTNPTINPKILTLKGVPGCGKTLFVQSIAKILKLPVQWIDLAGMNEVNFIKGFAKTWEGSKIGRLVEAIINLGSMNGIIVLEEIDKIESKTGHGSETLNALVPILDRTRNHEFYDNYLSDIPVPLNNIIFIGTCNEDKGFPKYLLDRLNIIECEKPDMPRKIKIAKEYLLPQALKERNLTKGDVIIGDEVIKYIIEKYTDEPGVRTLKERIQSVVQRVNYFATIKNPQTEDVAAVVVESKLNTSLKMPKSFTLPYTVTTKDVDEFLKFQKPNKENLTYFL